MGELQARGLSVRQLLHPTFKTQRDAAGRLKPCWDPATGLEQRAPGELHRHLPGPASLRRRAGRSCRRPLGRPGRGESGGHGLEAHAAAGRGRRAAPEEKPSTCLRRTPKIRRVSALARRRQLHVPRRTRVSPRRQCRDRPSPTGHRRKLGVLRDPDVHVPGRAATHASMMPGSLPVLITKASVQARVHRRVYMDCVSVETYRPLGGPDGEVRFVGLFTSQAYTTSPREPPCCATRWRRSSS